MSDDPGVTGHHGGLGSPGDGGIQAENMVWIFGTGRSGSTWLASMLGEPSGVIGKPAPRTQDRLGHKFWNEPLVGQLLGHFYTEVPSRQLQRENFIFSHSKRDVWLEGIRRLVMDGARTRFPEVSETGYLVIKEPNGSVGAPLLMEALPESRMVLLIRDPRDVAASPWTGTGRAASRTRRGGKIRADERGGPIQPGRQPAERFRERTGDQVRQERDPGRGGLSTPIEDTNRWSGTRAFAQAREIPCSESTRI